MKKKRKNMSHFFVAMAVSAMLTSCMTTRTSVGAYSQTQGEETLYAKGRKVWLFWGLIPLNEPNVNTPSDGNCQVVTKYKFVDFLINGFTGGLVTSYSINVKTKKK
ncbi:MAG: hypothetical protein JST67_10870 [Bacteroidetes bacterium]|nr:hypothetical protein [Bacteroidota bacterium]